MLKLTSSHASPCALCAVCPACGCPTADAAVDPDDDAPCALAFLRIPRGRTPDECDGLRAGGELGESTCMASRAVGGSEESAALLRAGRSGGRAGRPSRIFRSDQSPSYQTSRGGIAIRIYEDRTVDFSRPERASGTVWPKVGGFSPPPPPSARTRPRRPHTAINNPSSAEQLHRARALAPAQGRFRRCTTEWQPRQSEAGRCGCATK